MISLIPQSIKINFMGARFVCLGLSFILLIGSLVLLGIKGLNYGIDFAGGTLVQAKLERAAPIADMRAELDRKGWAGVVLQEYGAADEILVRVPNVEGETGQDQTMASRLAADLNPVAGQVEIRRVEFVGPQVGDELKRKGLLAILFASLAIGLYIAVRFEWRFAMGALFALVHDVLLTLGMFSLLQKEITLPVLAAFLTVIGYSLNDTVVVFDRIRENMRRLRKSPLVDVMNVSINEVLNRTLVMSVTTLVVLLALFYYGGEVIHDFAFALIIGVVVGTYSSTYSAAPVVLWLEKIGGAMKRDSNHDTDSRYKA